jgi:hypothetical protein
MWSNPQPYSPYLKRSNPQPYSPYLKRSNPQPWLSRDNSIRSSFRRMPDKSA